MKKAILFLVSLLSFGYLSSQDDPSSNQNYIRTRTYTQAQKKNYLDKIIYFDGL